MARSEDEVRLRDLGNRIAKQERLLLNKQDPIKREIDKLTKQWGGLNVKREDLRKLKEQLEASYTKFNMARAHASQVGVEVSNIETDLVTFEALDE